MPPDPHVKVIVQIDKIESLGDHPHRMFYKGGGLAVSEDFTKVSKFVGRFLCSVVPCLNRRG